VTPITGLPQVNGWAQVITHPSRSLTCVLSVSGKNANSVGKTLAEQVAHFPVATADRLHNSLLDLLQRARQEDCRLQLACILLTENKNIIATYSGSVFLRRKGRVGEILASEGDLKIVEGVRVPNDLFVLTTKQAANFFPELKTLLQRDTETLVTQLVAQLHSQENSALSALAWVENGEIRPENTSDFAEGSGGLLGKLNLGGVLTQAGQKIKSTRWHKNPLFLAKKTGQKIKNLVNNRQQLHENLLGKSAKPATRNFIILGGVVILLLIGIIFWKQRQINLEVQSLQPRLGELEQQLDQAQSLADNDPITARTQAREVLRGLEDLIATNQDKEQAVKRLKQNYQLAQAFLESMSGTETTGPLEPFFDLRLTEAGFVAQQIAVNEKILFALDAAGEKIISLDLENKQTTQISLENAGKVRALTANDETVYVLANGLHAYDLTTDNRHTQLKEEGDSDRGGTLLDSFTTYLYVFNPEQLNIYRWLVGDEGLSDPIGWLVDKQGLEFGDVESLTIDGDLWLATQSGELLKYTQGVPQAFSITDLPTPFDSTLKVATHVDSEYLYVLERSRQRLVILRKDGSFLREIVSESMATADALATSTSEDAVFIVSGSLVYKISL
jgi:hypothetical protein